MVMVTATRIGDRVLGRTCTIMMRHGDRPDQRAASTKGSSTDQQHLAADDAGEVGPAEQGEGQHDVVQPGAKRGRQSKDEDQQREAQEGVGDRMMTASTAPPRKPANRPMTMPSAADSAVLPMANSKETVRRYSVR